jgi:hypothetical protein
MQPCFGRCFANVELPMLQEDEMLTPQIQKKERKKVVMCIFFCRFCIMSQSACHRVREEQIRTFTIR